MNRKYLSIGVILILVLISYFVINKNGTKEALVLTEEHKVQNLTAFAKLYGYVRYFHPSDEAEELDWNTFAMYGTQQVKNAKSDQELKETLEALFSPIAPTIKLFIDEQDNYSYQDFFEADLDQKYVFWQHQGVQTSITSPEENFLSKRVFLINNQNQYFLDNQIFDHFPPDDKWVVNQKLSDRLDVYIPIVLPINQNEETIGSTQDSKAAFEALQNELKIVKKAGIRAENEDARISGVIIAWNVYQHFYPYLDVVDVNWEEELPAFIARVIHDETYEDYVTSLKLLVEKVQDAGSSVSFRDDYRTYSLPIRIKMIEDQIVVTESLDEKQIKVGDVVLSIDGVSAVELFTKLESEISGTPQYKKALAELMLVQGPFEESSNLEILQDGQRLHVSQPYTERIFHFTLQEFKEPIQEIKEGIYYIALHEEIHPLYLYRNLEKLTSAKGIIFDTRYYSMGSGSLFLPYLHELPISAPKMGSPQYVLPDQKGEINYRVLELELPIEEITFKGNIVFLSDGILSGWNEAILYTVEEYDLGTIIGQPTAGTIGNTNRFRLFDEIIISFTAQHTLKADGSQHHLIGVQPDIMVEQTLEAVKAGRDENIEKAIEFIEENDK